MKRYSLQQKVGYDEKLKMEQWKIIMEHDNYGTILTFMGYNCRIIDNKTGVVVARS